MALPLANPTAVVLELMTMGQQSAAHLGELLRAASPSPGEHQAIAAEILRCCDRVIAALSNKRKVAAPDHGAAACPLLPVTPPPPKRRARGAEARGEVVESSTTADGFMWRKYGQKEINGCKHPRLYYRCAHSGQGCGATRRVQRSQEEPAAFVIAYYGEHTCGAACQQAPPPPPPPTVVDSGSNARGGGVGVGVDRNRDSSRPLPLLPPAQRRRRGGQAPGEPSRGWSSSPCSSSSEMELGASPVLEFLEGCFDWESVVNSLGFGDLPQFAMLQ